MAIEEAMDRLAAALDRNTEAHGGKPAGKGAPAAGAAKTTPAAGKVTMEQVKAAVMGVKDSMGRPAALKVIKDFGKAGELNAIKPAQYSAVLARCAELMGEGESDDATDDAGDDDNL